jgi:uncharacterized protein YfaS (alpha-2-macroglobulin family)
MRTEYENKPLERGEALNVGDIVTIRLTLHDANGKRYIAISDPRPSCLEPISEEGKGYTREDRDAKTLFFLTQVNGNSVTLEYCAVVTCNGKFTALPALAFDMYAEDTWGRTAPALIGK